MKKALVIVAHPDDETIWMGGTILQNKNWDWTILSLCRANDKDRAPKFRKVCEKYGARDVMCDLDDEVLEPLDTNEIIKLIDENLPEKQFDYVFTHGQNGEYGHIRHKEIHLAVKEMIRTGKLEGGEVYFFAYEPSDERVPSSDLRVARTAKSFNRSVVLNNEELTMKREVIGEIYGFDKKSFEFLSCGNEERFIGK